MKESPFLDACRRRPTAYTPVWLMRQAGRYMPSYRAVRKRASILEVCKTPALACQVTVDAWHRLGVDAAIIFADLLLVLEPLGFRVRFVAGEGPVIDNPVRSPGDVARLRRPGPGALVETPAAIRMVRQALPANVPVIGFAGAPFTLASYAIEGGASRDFSRTRAFARAHPTAFRTLLSRIGAVSAAFLRAQITAGCEAVQVFDSWVGCLSERDYRTHAFAPTQKLFAALPRGIPAIHFGTGNAHLLAAMKEAGGNVIGLDWRVDLEKTWRALGPRVAVQGNLDPSALLGSRAELRREAQRVLDAAGGRRGHVFNLGHGVLPQTPPDNARALVDFVHEESARRRGNP